MALDLFNADAPKSFVRQAFKGRTPEVELADRFSFPTEWRLHRMQLPREGYFTHLWKGLDAINTELSMNGYQPEAVQAVLEAAKNAHEHGNLRNPEKYVTIGWRFNPDSVNIGVEDEGGVFHHDFGPWILRHREKAHLNAGWNHTFYTFSDKERDPKRRNTPEDNYGGGVTKIFTLGTAVQYHLSMDGGLVCTFRIDKNP